MQMHRAVTAALTLLLILVGSRAAECQLATPAEGVSMRVQNPLGPGDVLRISVWPNNDLGGEFVVEETGNVYLPILGELYVEGKSVDDLRILLRADYRNYVNNAVVTVTSAFTVGVLGEIQRPGLYTVSPTQTLFDVIGLAGGFSRDADQGRVRLVREGEAIQIDAMRALQSGEGLTAYALQSGDQIIVERRRRVGLEQMRSVLTFLQSIILAATLVERLR